MANVTRRALKLIKALQGKTFVGASVTELSQELGVSMVNTSRDLADLQAEGFATRREDGRWQLSISLLQIAMSYQDEYQRINARIHEINQRVTRY